MEERGTFPVILTTKKQINKKYKREFPTKEEVTAFTELKIKEVKNEKRVGEKWTSLKKIKRTWKQIKKEKPKNIRTT